MGAHLLVLGQPEGASWVLYEQRMAWTAGGARLARHVAPGDSMFVYASGNCWSGVPGGMGRAVIAEARVLTGIQPLPRRLRLAGRVLTVGCELFFESLAPFGAGLPLAAVQEELGLFRGSEGARLQRSPLLLTEEVAASLRKLLADRAGTYEDAIGTYPRSAAPVPVDGSSPVRDRS